MTDQPDQLPLADTFDGPYGVETLEIDQTHAIARVPVRNILRMPLGLVHGGVLASIAESITSLAVGLANDTSFLPITTGAIHAHATRRHHHRRTTWLWDFEITDDDRPLFTVTRMTITSRARRS